MAGFLDIINQNSPGGVGGLFANYLRGLYSQLPQSSLIGDINSGGYGGVIQGDTPSFNDRFSAAPPTPVTPAQSQIAQALPPPINVSALPQPAAPQDMNVPQQAQPIQYTPPPIAAPQPAPQVNPFAGFGNKLQDIAGILNPQLGNVLIARQNQQSLIEGTYKALIQRGMEPAQAVAIAQGISSNPKLAETILPQALGLNPPKTFEEFAARRASGENFPGVQNGSSPQAAYNDFLRNRAAAEAQGKTQGANAAELPKQLTGANNTINAIDDLIKDPGLEYITGPLSKLPNTGLIPAQSRAQAKMDMVRGQAFLMGVQSLKGNGMRVTNAEAMRAEQAQAQLNQAQSSKDLKVALGNMRNLMTEIAQNNQEMAGQPRTFQPATNAGSFTQDQYLAEARRRGLVR